MKTAQMQYEYSTKNFHRYAVVNGGVPKEVYIPRADMPKPVSEINVAVTVNSSIEVAEKVKAK